MIDLSPMRNVRVDTAGGVAYVGGGATWADVDHETQAHGLATTGGLVSSTGVGGFTLGGGIGWLMRKHGLACDNLVGADVVTADGQVVRASATDNPDLLWGLRGGGGNFGVATQLELALHPVGPLVHAGPDLLPGRRRRRPAAPLPRVGRRRSGRGDRGDQPDDGAAAAGDPGGLARQEGRCLRRVLDRSLEEADARVRPFREVAEPIADLLGPMPYHVIQTLLDPLWVKGIQSYFKGTNLSGSTTD